MKEERPTFLRQGKPAFRPDGKVVVFVSLAEAGETITVFPAGQGSKHFKAVVIGKKETQFGGYIYDKTVRKSRFIEAYRSVAVIIEGGERLSLGGGTAIIRIIDT